MRLSVEKCVAAAVVTALVSVAATAPAEAWRYRHRVHGREEVVAPRLGYGYGGYARHVAPAYVYAAGGYGYGYVGQVGLPYYYGGPYPYGYYQYPVGYQPNPYYGYGTGNYGTGLGY